MRRFWIFTTIGTIGALMGPGMALIAQESQRNDQQQSEDRQSKQQQSKENSKENSNENSNKQSRKNSNEGAESQSKENRNQNSKDRDEVRLKYDDDKNRLSIDVDEEIQFEDQPERRDAVRDGEIDLRYDADKNDLRASGEGTIDIDRAASQTARWWQSWWDDERRARSGRTEGASVGAAEFIRQYDDNDDQRLTARELPPHMRSDFQEIDRNGDNVLSRQELSRFGELTFDQRQQRNVNTRNQQTSRAVNTSNNNSDDRTWSEWWSSWWSSEQSGGSQQDVASSGSRRLLQTYDKNDDGFLTKSEIPARMQDDFEFVDRNNDGYVSRSEAQQYGYAMRAQSRSSSAYAANSPTTRQWNSNSQAGNNDEGSWDQWWSSWWSEESSGQDEEEIAANGVRQFIRQHDDNGDNVIVRSELPAGMYDEFRLIDTNSDRRLSRTEISNYASRTGERLASSRQQPSGSMGRSHSQSSDPMNTAYVWIIDVNHGHLKREELQKAYGVLRKIDANSDGQISQGELEQRREQAVAEWCEKCFEKLDGNNDSRLSRSEAEDSMFANSFDDFDANGDDRLSKAEARQGIQDQVENQSASRAQSGQNSSRY